jgi:hypothetical protein
MARRLWTLSLAAMIVGIAPAAAQVATPAQAGLRFEAPPIQVVTSAPAGTGTVGTLRLNIDPSRIVERLLSFDRDGDALVTSDELPERMQALVDRNDKNQDGFLNADEIRGSVDRRSGVRFSGGIGGNAPTGLPGLISDLKLPPPKREQALALAKGATFFRNINDAASVDLRAKMRELLDDEEFENFEAAFARIGNGRFFVAAVGGRVVLPK